MDEQRPNIKRDSSKITITTSISLLPITVEDYPQLWELMEVVYPKAYKHFWEDEGDWYRARIWNKKDVETELGNPHAFYSFVCLDDEIVGILRIIENAEFEDNLSVKALKLHRIYLDDKAQGRGLGKTIMHWVEAYARDKGHSGVWLEVMDTQHQALKFYERCGYKVTGDFRLDFKLMHDHLRGMHRMYKALD